MQVAPPPSKDCLHEKLGGSALNSSSTWQSMGNPYGSWTQTGYTPQREVVKDVRVGNTFAKGIGLDRGARKQALTPNNRHLTSSGLAAAAADTGIPEQGSHMMSMSMSTGALHSPEKARQTYSFSSGPGCSRGLPNGTMKHWSFDRVPSLLAERDRRQGTMADTAPPRAPSSRTSDDTGDFPRRAGGSGSMNFGMTGMTRSGSEPGMTTKMSGLQGVIGLTWDGAATTAGGGWRGSSGQFIGF